MEAQCTDIELTEKSLALQGDTCSRTYVILAKHLTPMTMSLHLPTLALVVCVVLLTTVIVMLLVGLSQRTYRGYWWWTAAQCLTFLSAVCLLFLDAHPWMPALSALLWLQWPMTMLVGMRQFYARTEFPTPQWVDGTLLLLGFWVLLILAQSFADDLGARVASFSMMSIGFFLYAARQIHAIRDWRQSAYLKALLFYLVAAALMQVPRLLSGLNSWGMPVSTPDQVQQPAVLVALVAGVIFSVYVCLLLTYERTEHELRESHRQLRVMTDFDMLTQLPNRRHFNEMGMQALRLCPPGTSALMLFDIDHFKHINETQGHAAGDEALKLVAASARRLLRSSDLMGRLGGDEFVALLPETSVKDALYVAQRMARQVDRRRTELKQTPLSMSFGVVQIMPGENLADATHRAVLALDEARRQGDSRFVSAEEEDGMPVFSPSQPVGDSVF